MNHELKTDPAVFDCVADNTKTFEICKNDRDFKVGDTLSLRRTKFTGEQMQKGAALVYTGKRLLVKVTHIMHGPIYGLLDGWVIMSIRNV